MRFSTSSSPPSSFSFLPVILLLVNSVRITNALVTLDTIRDLTILTDESKERIVDVRGLSGVEGLGAGQAVLAGHGAAAGGGSGREEVEETISAALHMLSAELLRELEIPIERLKQDPLTQAECKPVISAHHDFLRATTRLLYSVQEKQLRFRWGSDSLIVDNLAWLQSLWASRSANNQDRSFIEQRQALYKATTCFGKAINKEVLQRDVEIVEYLNDLIDSFS